MVKKINTDTAGGKAPKLCIFAKKKYKNSSLKMSQRRSHVRAHNEPSGGIEPRVNKKKSEHGNQPHATVVTNVSTLQTFYIINNSFKFSTKKEQTRLPSVLF